MVRGGLLSVLVVLFFAALPAFAATHPVPLDKNTDAAKCLECHTGHGVGNSSSNPTGQRLISFDANVVAPNAGAPTSYNQGPNTCTLTCHGAAHNPNGTVTLVGAGTMVKK
jgi:hypothetical protein